MLNFLPEGFISLIDARKRLTSELSKTTGPHGVSDNNAAKDAAEDLRNAFYKQELALYAVFDEDRPIELVRQLVDKAMPLKTGVLTFSHIGRGSHPPIGLSRKQIDRLAQDPLVVRKTEFQDWLKRNNTEPIERGQESLVAQRNRAKRRRGRPPTSGAYASDDKLIEEIHKQLLQERKQGQTTSLAKVILQFVERAEGAGQVESIIRRLRGKYSKKYLDE